MRRYGFIILLASLITLLVACGKAPSNEQAQSEQPSAAPASAAPGTAAPSAAPSSEPAPAVKTRGPAATRTTEAAAVLPAGEHIVIRLGETLSSKRNNTGDSFSGTVATPVSVNGKVVIPQGATATGTVADAKALGRFKGGAVLRIVLDQISVNGKNYRIETAAVSHSLKGKGKRSAVAIGGGAGLGALIGGLAGGGKGAAIGAAAGAGAGTAGAAFTGNKDIVLPAETAVSFKLLQPVEIK